MPNTSTVVFTPNEFKSAPLEHVHKAHLEKRVWVRGCAACNACYPPMCGGRTYEEQYKWMKEKNYSTEYTVPNCPVCLGENKG